MRTLRLLSLCSGIGGIDYAWSHLLGQAIAGQVENAPYCQAVLHKIWPAVPKRLDIQEVTDNDPFGDVDLVAGGVPCQPFSYSGQRRGTEDDRHLWPYALAIIERRQPTWVLIENVPGFISLALDLVQTDLEGAGYQTQAYVLPACAVGAPHIRERVFIVAYSPGRGCRPRRPECAGQQGPLLPDGSRSSCLADAERNQCRVQQHRIRTNAQPDGKLADSSSDRCGQWTHQPQRESQRDGTANPGNDGTQGSMAHADSQRQQECNAPTWGSAARLAARRTDTDVADPNSQRRPLPAPGRDAAEHVLECDPQGQPQPRMGRGSDGLSAWLDRHRWPAPPGPQEEWEPPRTISHKVPYRAARLKALGNAVVPQQIYPLLKFIIEIEQGMRQEGST